MLCIRMSYMYIKKININKAHKKRSSMMRINCDMARKFEFLVAVYVKQINAEQKNFFCVRITTAPYICQKTQISYFEQIIKSQSFTTAPPCHPTTTATTNDTHLVCVHCY